MTGTPDEHEANRTITERISPKTETPRVWVRKAEASDGGMPAASASEADAELQALRRKNAELEDHGNTKDCNAFIRSGRYPPHT